MIGYDSWVKDKQHCCDQFKCYVALCFYHWHDPNCHWYASNDVANGLDGFLMLVIWLECEGSVHARHFYRMGVVRSGENVLIVGKSPIYGLALNRLVNIVVKHENLIVFKLMRGVSDFLTVNEQILWPVICHYDGMKWTELELYYHLRCAKPSCYTIDAWVYIRRVPTHWLLSIYIDTVKIILPITMCRTSIPTQVIAVITLLLLSPYAVATKHPAIGFFLLYVSHFTGAAGWGEECPVF